MKKKSKVKISFSLIFLFFLAGLTSGLIIFQGIFSSKLVLSNSKYLVYSLTKKREFPRRLDGVFVFSKKLANPWPVAIVIDNQVESRPPVNLSKASLVIEVLTEANITRFLAFFNSSEQIDKIGPIRSARPYFLEWAEEIKPLFFHSGGSPQALQGLKQRKYDVYDVNEFYWGDYFWRDLQRKKPHNLFTSSSFWKEIMKLKKIQNKIPSYQSWIFKNDISYSLRKEKKQIIKINYQSPDYLVEWRYDPIRNVYFRYQGGRQHLDSNGYPLLAKNLIVQYLKIKVIDKIGRREIITQGEGKAEVFLDGRRTEGKWVKKAKLQRTIFYNDQGKEIRFNRGSTWIEVVPSGEEIVSYLE